jgi:hypothetical protein
MNWREATDLAGKPKPQPRITRIFADFFGQFAQISEISGKEFLNR